MFSLWKRQAVNEFAQEAPRLGRILPFRLPRGGRDERYAMAGIEGPRFRNIDADRMRYPGVFSPEGSEAALVRAIEATGRYLIEVEEDPNGVGFIATAWRVDRIGVHALVCKRAGWSRVAAVRAIARELLPPSAA